MLQSVEGIISLSGPSKIQQGDTASTNSENRKAELQYLHDQH